MADVQVVEAYLARQIEEPRLYAGALGAFGAVATTLAMFGIYGLIAYTVAQRAREIAIRMASGASARAVVRLVLRQVVWMTAIGIGVGVIVSLAVTHFLASVLWSVTPTDLATFVFVVMLFTVVAGLAAAVPTYQALRLEPRTVLSET